MMLRLAVAFLLALAGSPVCSAEVKVVVVGLEKGSNTPVPIEVRRRVGDGTETTISTGDLVSTIEFDEGDCSPTTAYLARPVAPSLYSELKWQTCFTSKTKYEFAFVRVAQRGAVKLAYALWTNEFSQVPINVAAPQFAPGIEILKSFAAEGDYGSISFISNEMAIALVKAGDDESARFFRFLAISSGVDAIVGLNEHPATSEAFLDPATGDNWLPSATALAEIVKYQSAQGLPQTGKLDWNTVKSTSLLAGQDIDKLSEFRKDAISAIDCTLCN